jgi:hypothetical protein
VLSLQYIGSLCIDWLESNSHGTGQCRCRLEMPCERVGASMHRNMREADEDMKEQM